MSAAFGIHFGSTATCLAVYRDGKTDVVANDLGDRVTPSMVAFTDHDQTVGVAARQGIIRNAGNTVCNVKQIIGRRFDDPIVQDYARKCSVKVINKSGAPEYEVDFKEKKTVFSPIRIAQLIYRKILDTAESHGGSGIQDAVLSVPLDMSVEQRNAISEAATKAGFSVLRLIPEPTAAVLAYDLGQADIHEEYNVLVFRLGGTSADASVVRLSGGLFRILSSVGEPNLGGEQFTTALAEYLTKEFQKQYRHDIRDNKRALRKMHIAAGSCKHTLSNLTNAHCAVDSLYEGMDFTTNVSRARLESLCTSLTQQCLQPVEQALKDADLTKDDINKLIICGGGAKVPVVQKTISEYFIDAEQLLSLPLDEVIAIGAAKEAAILVGINKEDINRNTTDTELECLSKPVCIKVCDEEGHTRLKTILPQHTPFPFRTHHSMVLGVEQTSFSMEIYEADVTCDLDSASLLARIVMDDLPAACTINSCFHIRREGSLHIVSMEKTSGKEESITIEMS